MSTTPRYDENELLRRVTNGDEQAFELLARQYAEKVFAHALSFVKSYPLAQEAVQDIFLKIWTNREKLTTIDSFDNYLFILSKNYLISALRRNITATEQLTEFSSWEEHLYRPDEQYSIKELKALLEKGISQLPLQKQQVFRMIHLEGMTQEKVAGIMGISERTVRYHLVAAMNALKEFLYLHFQGKVPVFLLFLPVCNFF